MINQTNATLQKCCLREAQQRPLHCCPSAFPWWCPSAILAKQQPWLFTRMRASPLHLGPASLHLNLSLTACQLHILQGFQPLNQQCPLYQSFSIPDIHLDGTPLLGCSLASLNIPPKGKQDHTSSDSPDHPHINRTNITSPEVEVGSEHSSTWGNDHMPNPTPETRTDSGQPQQVSPSPSSSPTRGPANSNDDAVASIPKSTGG